MFAVTVLFQLVTLPVEFGASRRAMQMLTAQGILTPDEAPMARKVLTAAALTYVIGTLIGDLPAADAAGPVAQLAANPGRPAATLPGVRMPRVYGARHATAQLQHRGGAAPRRHL